MERTYENHFEDRIETDEDLILRFDGRAEGNLLIFLTGEKDEVHIDLESRPSSNARIFIQNAFEHPVKIVIKAKAENDAKLRLGLLDLQDHPCELKFDGDLVEEGADIEFYTAQLCLRDKLKKGDLNLNSLVPHTFGNMHNFAVCFDGGRYEMAASGRIVKGAFGSESHQETRVLTMGKDHKAVAIPILYIDENDVKASHALTIGQPDADQLYYLQSRGLSTRQAVGLLSIGYFKPVISLIEDESAREAIESRMEERVGLYEY